MHSIFFKNSISSMIFEVNSEEFLNVKTIIKFSKFYKTTDILIKLSQRMCITKLQILYQNLCKTYVSHNYIDLVMKLLKKHRL